MDSFKDEINEILGKVKGKLKSTVPDFEAYEDQFDEFWNSTTGKIEEYQELVEDYLGDLGGDYKETVSEYKSKIKDWLGRFGRDIE